MADERIEEIEDAAKEPKAATGDAGSVEQHPLDEQIEVDRYKRSEEATQKGQGLGVKITKTVPPGAS